MNGYTHLYYHISNFMVIVFFLINIDSFTTFCEKILYKFEKKLYLLTATFDEGKKNLPDTTVREALCIRRILNIILKEVCIRRRILLLISKCFHISSWACQGDDYIYWPMCLECYPDRYNLAFGFQWLRLYQILYVSCFILWLVSYFLKILSSIDKLGCLQKETICCLLWFYIQQEFNRWF